MEIVHDCDNQEFVLLNDDGRAIGKITYSVGAHSEIYVPHTEVNPAYEGRGYARQLVDALVAFAKEQNAKIVPLCPYVARLFRKFPDEYAKFKK